MKIILEYFFFPSNIYRKGHVPPFEQTKIPITQRCIVPCLPGPVVLELIFKVCQCTFTMSLCLYLPLQEGTSLRFKWATKINKRPMGHIAHLRKQFKSIYHNVDKEKEKPNYQLFRYWMVLHLNKFKSPSPRMLSAKWLKLSKWFWRRGFLNFVNVFSLFRNNLPLKREDLHLYGLKSPSPKNALCKVWLKLTQWFWRRRFFKISSMYFRYFVIISLWKRAGPSFEQTWMNSHHPWMVCVKFGWIWFMGFVEDENVKSWRQRKRQRRQDDGQRTILIRKTHLSLRLRWAKN